MRALCDKGMISAQAQAVGEEEGDGSLDTSGLPPWFPNTGQIHVWGGDI